MSFATSTLPTQISDATAFTQQLARLILLGDTKFYDVWDIANRVCDEYAAEIAAAPPKWTSTQNYATAA